MTATAAATAHHGVIARYHDLLTDDVAAETQAQLDEGLRRLGLFFGDRPLCTVLRPRFMSAPQYRAMQGRAAILLKAFDKSLQAAMATPKLREQFRLLDWEERLVQVHPRFRDASPTSRLDAFFTEGDRGLRFTEYNAETPAGAGFNDILTELFYGFAVMRRFLRRYDVLPLPVRHSVMHVLLHAYAQWSDGAKDKPRIGILDWREVPTTREFTIFQEYFQWHGLDCMIGDPRDAEYRDGKLFVGGQHVNLIYKRVLISELVERCGEDGAVIRAVKEGAACMVNPFRCKILHKKASLAVLSDERNASLYTEEERQAIEEHIPFTRVVEERQTSFHGQRIDLLPFIAERREQMVLKPNDEYGGKGIVLGWEVSDAEWKSAIATALGEPYIVQERIILPTEPYPNWIDGRVQIHDRMVDTAPFCFDGSYVAGCMTRIGTTSLINVTAGGGSSVPTFLVEQR
ncbi:MAG: hypothetical protein M3081_12760 [Gemmatimonadota bacterium]|nr:hypothetical protein [Gemmatimonadota bacterium]